MNMQQSDRERLNMLAAASREYEAQAQQIQMQLGVLDQSIRTTQLTVETVENFKNLQNGQEILLPLGNQVFIKAKLADSSNVLLNVGASVVLEKTIDQTNNALNQRIENLSKTQIQLKQALQQMIQKMEQIRNEIERLVRKIQQPQQPMRAS